MSGDDTLSRQVIKLWIVVYHGDIRQSYVMTDFKKVVASVESSIRGYFDDTESCDALCKNISHRMRALENALLIPIKVDDFQILVHRWELDHMTKVHQVLAKCHDIAPTDLKEEIEGLFVPSACVV